MTKPNFEAAKGTKDWYGRETILRNQIRATLQNVFERYGYDRLETPMIETRTALAFKGGGEIQKEVFTLSDQGKRELALRFDQTVPLARYIASVPDIKFPFKRYVIGEVFRDGPTQPDQGRYRQFTQCDVDVVGVKEMTAEAELFALAQDAFRELGLGGVEVNINNRKLLEGILDYAGVSQEARLRTIVTLDKLDKIGVEGLKKELAELRLYDGQRQISNDTLAELFNVYDSKGALALGDFEARIKKEVSRRGYQEIAAILQEDGQDRQQLYQRIASHTSAGELLLGQEQIGKILEVVNISSNATNEEVHERLNGLVTSQVGRQGLEEVKTLLGYAKAMDFNFIRLNPSLARGLDYYTGTTIEVYLKDRTIVPSAILAGGRFDDMIGDFRGLGEELPAVGFSFGLERLAMILGQRGNIPATVRELYVVPIGETQSDCLRVAHDLRNQGLKVDISLQKGLKVGKVIEFASKAGIPFVAFVGENELRTNSVRIKNLQTGEQGDVSLTSVKDYIRNPKPKE